MQAIYRDEEKTKEQLLGEFQNKISDKDQEMKNELEKYLNENMNLRVELRQIQDLMTRQKKWLIISSNKYHKTNYKS